MTRCLLVVMAAVLVAVIGIGLPVRSVQAAIPAAAAAADPTREVTLDRQDYIKETRGGQSVSNARPAAPRAKVGPSTSRPLPKGVIKRPANPNTPAQGVSRLTPKIAASKARPARVGVSGLNRGSTTTAAGKPVMSAAKKQALQQRLNKLKPANDNRSRKTVGGGGGDGKKPPDGLKGVFKRAAAQEGGKKPKSDSKSSSVPNISRAFNIKSFGWPNNDGFLGKPRKAILPVGTKIDRYGHGGGHCVATWYCIF